MTMTMTMTTTMTMTMENDYDRDHHDNNHDHDYAYDPPWSQKKSYKSVITKNNLGVFVIHGTHARYARRIIQVS